MSGPNNPTPDAEPTVIQVEVERVSGVIPLADLADRITQQVNRPVGLAAESLADPIQQARLQRVSELIRQLGEEMAQLPEGL